MSQYMKGKDAIFTTEKGHHSQPQHQARGTAETLNSSLNSGSFLVRNTAWAQTFLYEWLEMRNDKRTKRLHGFNKEYHGFIVDDQGALLIWRHDHPDAWKEKVA